MAEKVIIRQNRNYESDIMASDPDAQGNGEVRRVESIYSLTPYGMMLASLGFCTSVLLYSYSENRGIDLREVEVTLEYERTFREDCGNCEEIEAYDEQITEKLVLNGNLTEEQRKKLHAVSKQCPIRKILRDGISVETVLA